MADRLLYVSARRREVPGLSRDAAEHGEISVPIGGTSDKMKEGSVRTCNDSSRMSAQERLPVNCNRIGKTSIAIAKICEATAKV